MAPTFKPTENSKHKTIVRQAKAKVGHRPESSGVYYDAATMQETGYKRMIHHPGGVTGWEGASSQSTAVRSMGRKNLDEATIPTGYSRRPEMPEESSDDDPDTRPHDVQVDDSDNSCDGMPEESSHDDPGTRHDVELYDSDNSGEDIPEESSDDDPNIRHDAKLDDSDNSGDDEPVSPQTAEEPPNSPIIEPVARPPWLPKDWKAVRRTRGSRYVRPKDIFYVDPVSLRRFRTRAEVKHFQQTGKCKRYGKRALSTQSLEEGAVPLQNCSVSSRTVPVDVPTPRESPQTLPFVSPSAIYGSEHRGNVIGHGQSSLSPNQRLSMVRLQAGLPRKPYNKAGPEQNMKPFTEDPGMSSMFSWPKGSIAEDRKALESSHGQGTENRGKLIVKLKCKPAKLEEGERNGKKPRPLEFVGVTAPVLQGKSRSSISDKDERHLKNPLASDHIVESSSRAPVPQSLVPATQTVSRKPMTKARRPSSQHQPHQLALRRPQSGGNSIVSSSGQSHMPEKIPGSATLVTTKSETVKGRPKRDPHKEQLQTLGRNWCLQTLKVLRSENEGSNPLEQISKGLHSSESPAPYQEKPLKKMQGSRGILAYNRASGPSSDRI